MSLYQNNNFLGQKIQIDGHRFVRNRFENCVLVYGGGPLQLVENTLINVTWEFTESAARTIALLASFYQSGEEGGRFIEHLLSTFGRVPAQPEPEPAPAVAAVPVIPVEPAHR